MHHHHHYHETKKKKILRRNKRHLIIFQMAQIAQEETQNQIRAEGLSARQRVERQRGAKGPKEPVWSAKLQKIRNKNDGSKREAKERWNRFAGTSDGGARGL